jgi:hypothetical protein
MSDTLNGSSLSDNSVTESKLITTFTTKVTNAYNSANNAYAKANTAVTNDGTITGNLTIGTNLAVGGSLIVGETIEQINVSATAMAANLNFDILTQPILYLTSSATANCTVNFRGNSTITLESFMTTGNSITVSLLNTNGATAFKANNVQVDGVPITPKWAGGVVPSIGNASSVDLYSFTIIKTASLNYTILASLQKYA